MKWGWNLGSWVSKLATIKLRQQVLSGPKSQLMDTLLHLCNRCNVDNVMMLWHCSMLLPNVPNSKYELTWGVVGRGLTLTLPLICWIRLFTSTIQAGAWHFQIVDQSQGQTYVVVSSVDTDSMDINEWWQLWSLPIYMLWSLQSCSFSTGKYFADPNIC